MELDELKQKWTSVEQLLETNQKLYLELIRKQSEGKLRQQMKKSIRTPVFELVSGILATLLLGGFIADYFNQPKFCYPAIMLHLFVIFSLIVNTRIVVLTNQMDYSLPVMELQNQILYLRNLRIKLVSAILLLSPLLWVAMLIVVAKGLFNYDIYSLTCEWRISPFQTAGFTYVSLNILFGIAFIPLAYVGVKNFIILRLKPTTLDSLCNAICGKNLTLAMNSSDDLKENY